MIKHLVVFFSVWDFYPTMYAFWLLNDDEFFDSFNSNMTDFFHLQPGIAQTFLMIIQVQFQASPENMLLIFNPLMYYRCVILKFVAHKILTINVFLVVFGIFLLLSPLFKVKAKLQLHVKSIVRLGLG